MDGDIKKEASLFGKKEYESLFEYTPSGTEKPDIIDERASIDDWSSIKAKSQRIQETNPTNRLPYPWEQPESETYFDSPSTKDPKPYVKKTYLVNGIYSSEYATETIIETINPIGSSVISPPLNLRGKYGTFKSSKKSKNAPLIFILGGLTWPDTKATDAQIGNGKNDSRYPGDKKEGVDGYMWVYGFNTLVDFNIYNCFTHKDGNGGWNECSSILSSNAITPEKKILVAFSAGVNMIHEGLLKKAPANTWNIIHLIGGTDGAMNRCKSILQTPNVDIYYIQSKGIETSSEGIDSNLKKEIASKLPKGHVLNSSDHANGVTISSQWINSNVKVANPPPQTGGTKRVIVRGGRNLIRILGKYKGQASQYVKSSGGIYNLGPITPLPAAPPADPKRKAQDIAELKADPGYKKRWYSQVALNGGDRWLGAVYDECVQIRCVFWHLMFVMAIESGLSPMAKNKVSPAAGLIQWTNYRMFRAQGFADPRQANAFQQLPFIKKYYEGRPGWKKNGVPNLVAAYTYVSGGNTSNPNKAIYIREKDPRVFRDNSVWNANNDGVITAGEITLSAVRKWYDTKDTSWVNKYPNGIWRKEPILFTMLGIRR